VYLHYNNKSYESYYHNHNHIMTNIRQMKRTLYASDDDCHDGIGYIILLFLTIIVKDILIDILQFSL